MRPFIRHEGIAAPLPEVNLDTDRILPARFLKKPRDADYATYLFHDLRRDPEGVKHGGFILDQPPFDEADILIAGDNFGCGSSREGAVYALVDHGLRAVIASSFGDIFRNNSLKNGLLPVVLPEAMVEDALARAIEAPGTRFAIDLPNQTVTLPGGTVASFEIDPFRKDLLMKGLDEMELTVGMAETIAAFEASHQAAWPWAHPGAPEDGR